ncbi:retinitis pigmentosa 1-like 1 protein [Penaeus japonicus]|uniref:retinitis pigmentosa 1-like 1 protein n=1 Tax=Penaeus japonicus TaxID=27405 RepID=UPI001C714ABF|nr:retinitis pigmentosa 1-like 1 protein [Penaeus japonicus]
MDIQGLRHLQALRSFIGNLVDQAERSVGCDCHKPPSLLLVGPPGAGKTYLVKQMSNVCEMPLYGVHTHQVRGAQQTRKLFEQARDNYPSLVFMDDVDAIFSDHDLEPRCSASVQVIRDELFAQLGPRKLKIVDPKSSKNPTGSTLPSPSCSSSGRGVNGVSGSSRASSRASTMSRPPRPSAPPNDEDDVYPEDEDSPYPDNNGIIVVAATSAPWLLYKDHELLSRFRGVYLVGLPDKQARYNLLTTLFQDVHHSLSDKDIMTVAEKTEGFTPADLMVVVKTLTYRQFSYLLTMTSPHVGSVDGSSSDLGSSGSRTPLSSEMSESGSESDLDGLPESESHLKRGVVSVAAVAAAVAAASGAVPKKDLKPPTAASKKVTRATPPPPPPPAAAPAPPSVTSLCKDWDSDDDDEHTEGPHDSPESQRDEKKIIRDDPQAPTRVLEESMLARKGSSSASPGSKLGEEVSVPSPDSAIGMSKSSEEVAEPASPSRLPEQDGAPSRWTPLESSSSGVTSSGCDSSDSSAIVDEGVGEAGDRAPPAKSDSATKAEEEEEEEEEVEEEEALGALDGSGEERESGGEAAEKDSSVVEGEGDKEPESEGAHCDNEAKEERNKTENSESCDHDEGRVGTPVEFELHYSEPPEPMRDDNCAIDSDSDNDMVETPRSRGGRRVAFSGMSPMEPLSVDVGDNCGPPNISLDDIPPNISLAPSNLPEPMLADDRHQDAAPNAILLSLLSRPAGANRSERRDRHLDEPSELASLLHPDHDLDVNKTSTPIEPMGPLTPTPNLSPTPTPTPSEGSSHNGTVGSSGSGTHNSGRSTSSEVRKKDDSDSSFDHSDTHTVPSSDISTATCNETGETMECRTDSEERLQGLEDAHNRADSDRGSEYDTPTEAKAVGGGGGLNSLLSDFGEISIQLISLADVLEVVSKGYRSVSDEEIKRYTDFMVWFSNVAKSACPHSKDGSHKANAPPLDDISVDSTIYDTPSIAKKRKGPLRKLGRFLLKALMFILD